ncbi:MAG: hypothetical protein SGARI_000254, partial [Bacillariaceae sp.]
MSSSNKDNGKSGGSTKLAFSLSTKKKSKASAPSTSAFQDDEDEDHHHLHDQNVNTDIPKEPLVIPLQPNTNDVKITLAEHVKAKEEQGAQQNGGSNDSSKGEDEDQAAIEALKREAAGGNAAAENEKSSKMVIDGTTNTFQRNDTTETNEQFQEDLEKLPQDLSVESQVYKAVPIAEFGAAMLRGMGWTGASDNNGDSKKGGGIDPTTMPRPSRLGLGATPKMLAAGEDAPATHGRRRPRRHDQ